VVVNGEADFDQQPTAGSYGVTEAYLELRVPLLKDRLLAKDLSLDGAARFSDVGHYGSAKTWNATLTDTLSNDLLLRGNIGTGFRAPSIPELFSGQYDSPVVVNDPCDISGGVRLTNAVAAANCNKLLTASGVNAAKFLQSSAQLYSLQGGNLPAMGLWRGGDSEHRAPAEIDGGLLQYPHQ
jgi:iron complex outermembrane receptor protein